MRWVWGLVLAVLALSSASRAYDWTDDRTVWTAATVAQPSSPRAWLNRCAAESVPEWCYRAWRLSLSLDALTQRRTEAIALVNLSLIADERGDALAAKTFAQQVLRRFPQWPRAHVACDTVDCNSF